MEKIEELLTLLLVKNKLKKIALLKTTLNSKEKTLLWKSPSPKPENHPIKLTKELIEKIPEILKLKKPNNLDNLDNKNLENPELMLPEKNLIPYLLEI